MQAQERAAAETAADALARATAAERAAEPVLARAEWQRVIALEPGSRLARRAEGRIAWIDARAEADFAPLRALMAHLETPVDARDARVVAAFEEVVVHMPENGLVRRESRQALLEDWLRLEDATRALAAARAWEREAQSATEERLATEAVARALALGGARDEAIETLDAAGLSERSTRGELARQALDAWSRPLAIALLSMFALGAAVLGARSLRRRGRRALLDAWSLSRVGGALWIVSGPLVLATLYDDEATDTFARLALGTLLIAAAAALGTLGLPGTRGRAAWAACVVSAELALAWLVLLGSGGLVSFP